MNLNRDSFPLLFISFLYPLKKGNFILIVVSISSFLNFYFLLFVFIMVIKKLPGGWKLLKKLSPWTAEISFQLWLQRSLWLLLIDFTCSCTTQKILKITIRETNHPSWNEHLSGRGEVAVHQLRGMDLTDTFLELGEQRTPMQPPGQYQNYTRIQAAGMHQGLFWTDVHVLGPYAPEKNVFSKRVGVNLSP